MTDWRALEISQCVAEVRKLIGRNSTRDVILSAVLVADAALNHRSLEKYGRSYTELAARLDWVVPMANFRSAARPVDPWQEPARTVCYACSAGD